MQRIISYRTLSGTFAYNNVGWWEERKKIKLGKDWKQLKIKKQKQVEFFYIGHYID